MNKERIVIVAYKPFPNMEAKLAELMKDHVKILRKEGLASDREPILMHSKNGTIIEVFGWRSKEAIESAHSNPAVQKMWGAYAEVCEYVPVGNLEEAANMFSEFTPL